MKQINQTVLKTFIAIIIIMSGLSAVMVLTTGDYKPVSAKLFAVTYSMFLYGITSSICMVVSSREKYRSLGIAGISVSAAGFALNLFGIFSEVPSITLFKLIFGLMIAAIALAHISFLYYLNMQNKYASTARTIAVVFISIFSFLIIVRVFGNIESIYSLYAAESYLRFVVAALTIDLAATLLVPLCNRLQASQNSEPSSGLEIPAPENDVPVEPVS